MTQDPAGPKDPVFDSPPLSLEEELAAARAEPEPGPDIDTVNESLSDGLNRCPKCGSTDVRLRGSTGQLVCLFCRHEWQEDRVEEEFGLGEGIDQLEGTVIASGAQDIQADVADQLTFKCEACGAEVVVDTAHSLNARCHWCRHTLNVNQQVPNGAVPDAVLPFRLTKDEAVEKIREFASKRRLFALGRFKKEFVPENVLGVYLPYLVVDARAESQYWGKGEVQTRRWTEKSGDNTVTYYAADVYQLTRQVAFTVDDLTLEGSSERAQFGPANTNNIINSILPFDTKNAVRWNASYLVGFTSEKRDRDVSGVQPVLEDQLLSIGRSQVSGTLGKFGRGVSWEQEKIDVGGSRWVSMYLPVWLYSYRQESSGLLHYIAVNGRTGETMGSVPVAQWKLLLAAFTVGTFLEGIAGAILVGGGVMLDLALALADAATPVVQAAAGDDDGGLLWLLAAGPAGAVGTYWALYRYYRNTDKTHHYERDTIIEAQPVQGSEEKIDHISRTRDSDIDGDNSRKHRERVQRIR